jgi:hypothetical protein
MSRERISAAVAMMCVLGAGLPAAVSAEAASAPRAVRVPCSVGGRHGLIAAIKAANRAGGGVLNLAARCRYTLRTRNNTADGGNGLPVLTGRITITGGRGTIIVRRNAPRTPEFRIIEVGKRGNVAITHVTLTGGRLSSDSSQGGGIDNEGTIRALNQDTIRGNSAALGGGVFNNGTINDFSNDSLLANTAGNGGAVANLTRIRRFSNDEVVGNRAGIGGGITNGGAIASLSHSVISDNRLTSNGAGGGIANSFGLLNMSDDIVARNAATAGPQASGGGIDNSGHLTLTHSVVRDNVARGVGGGIRNEEQQDPRFSVDVRSTRVIRNTVTSSRGPATGGGIFNAGALTLTASTVQGNRARTATGRAVGAGIYNASSLGVSQTLITGNVVSDPGGEAEGGGLYVDEGSKRSALARTRIIGNTATGAHPHGGGIFFAGGSPVRLTGGSVQGNRPEDCYPLGAVAGCHA